MSTRAEPKHRGTLVCVVLKAKNLPNKRSIGKQDPYCVLQIGTEQHKTKPDKRGGQHPQWDEQLHFEIYDDMEDQLRKQEGGENDGNASLSQATRRKSKAGKSLRVSCYADDNKEPEFIGEGVVDLTDTLRSGEFDEWVTIKAKDRYAGEVYLELTFYSSAAPPKPKKVLKPSVPANTTYGGAGTFSEDFDESEFAPRPPNKASTHAPIPSAFVQPISASTSYAGQRLQNGSGMTTSQTFSHMSNRTGMSSAIEHVPSSLRPSASIANLDTYTPPYAPSTIHRERSPAPTQADPSAVLPPSASAQFYGHRLPDAAPASVVAQRMEDDARRHSQQMSSSSTFHHLPQATSTSTIRPLPRQQSSIDDLIRPLSSLSMQTLPTVNEAGRIVPTQAPGQYAQQSHEAVHNQQQWYAQQPTQVDQYGRPLQGPIAAASYSQLPIAPTPPIHPHSAPPATHHADLPQSQSYASGWTQSQPPQPLPPPPQHPSTITASPSVHLDNRRPVSPNPGAAAPPPPPPRAHTPSGYQNLPAPPASAPPMYSSAAEGQSDTAAYGVPIAYQQLPQQQQLPYGQYAPPPGSYTSSPPKPSSGRPLPQVHPSSHTASPAIVSSQLPAHPSTQQFSTYEAGTQSQWQHATAASSTYPPPARSQSPLPPPPPAQHQSQAPQTYAQQQYPAYPPPASPRPSDIAATPTYVNGYGAPPAAAAYEGLQYGGVVSPTSYAPAPAVSSAHQGAPPPMPSHFYPPPSDGGQNVNPSALYERTYAPNPSAYPPPLPSSDSTSSQQQQQQQYQYAHHVQAPPSQHAPPSSVSGAYYTAAAAPPTYPHPPASYYKPTYANQQAPSPY